MPSARRSCRLWIGRPSAVPPRLAAERAAGERAAGAERAGAGEGEWDGVSERALTDGEERLQVSKWRRRRMEDGGWRMEDGGGWRRREMRR